MFFPGDGGKRKIDLRGRSAETSKSREALLEEARREREARSAAKRRGTAALRLQAAWRGGRARAQLRGVERAAFIVRY